MVTSRSVWLAMVEDGVFEKRLIELARTHSKLAFEHIGKLLVPIGENAKGPNFSI